MQVLLSSVVYYATMHTDLRNLTTGCPKSLEPFLKTSYLKNFNSYCKIVNIFSQTKVKQLHRNYIQLFLYKTYNFKMQDS